MFEYRTLNIESYLLKTSNRGSAFLFKTASQVLTCEAIGSEVLTCEVIGSEAIGSEAIGSEVMRNDTFSPLDS